MVTLKMNSIYAKVIKLLILKKIALTFAKHVNLIFNVLLATMNSFEQRTQIRLIVNARLAIERII
jgi:hypothetical protein